MISSRNKKYGCLCKPVKNHFMILQKMQLPLQAEANHFAVYVSRRIALRFFRRCGCLCSRFFTSPSRARTYNPAVNSRVLYH